jgi:hypothetical protein
MTRGPHGRDRELFAPRWHGALRRAVGELSWLLSRDYAQDSALKLVGDRHRLRARQRAAVLRCACSDAARAHRQARRLPPERVAGTGLAIDGFNCLITTECALASALVLVGRDGAHRDLAGVHGTYRRAPVTPAALAGLGAVLQRLGPREVTWMLDRPVSNSGRLRSLLLHTAEAHGWPWRVELDDGPDRRLASWDGPVATSDGWILDRTGAWVDLPGLVIAGHAPGAWVLDLG